MTDLFALIGLVLIVMLASRGFSTDVEDEKTPSDDGESHGYGYSYGHTGLEDEK